MSVPPRRGLNRRPARGFGQKKDSSLGKAPSRSTQKKRFSISDAFKKGQERRRIRKIKRQQEKKLREYGPIKIKRSVDSKKPRKPVTGSRPKGSGQRVRRSFTKGRGIYPR